jgi:putative DNA primase/helicase
MSDDWLPDVSNVHPIAPEDEVKRLAALSPAAYETERKAAAKLLGWRTSALDDAVEAARPKQEDKVVDTSVEDLDPWPDPVDGASLAEEVRQTLTDHVIFAQPSDADAAAIWAIGSYLMDTWRLWPRLLITSPTKECGKSTLLEALEALVSRGLILSNAKSAGVFRAIEAWQPTLLLDEADTWMRQDDELAGILNSGHTKRTARVIRVVDVRGELIPTLFSTWCPMVIAGIGGQRDTLMSRSIIIGLRRKLGHEAVNRMPFDLHDRCTRIRRQALRWAIDNSKRIGTLSSEPQESGSNRRRDNFTPLWRIAEVLGDVWPARIAAAYAAEGLKVDDDDEPAHILLLHDVLAAFEARRTAELTPGDLVGELIQMDDRPWSDWRNGRSITSTAVAKMLKGFGIKSSVKKVGGRAVRAYSKAAVSSAAEPYTAAKCNPVTVQQNQQVSGNQSVTEEAEGYTSETPNPLKTNEGYRVTVSTPPATDYELSDDPMNPEAWS